MKRLFAILVLGFLALGIAGLSAGTAGAGPANCAPNTASILDDFEATTDLAAYAERPAAKSRSTLADGPQLACNSACARACSARHPNCTDRACRRSFSSCMRGCGCGG